MAAHGQPDARERSFKVLARDILWRLLNIVAAGLWIAVAAFHFVDRSFQAVLPGIAVLLVGVGSIVLEFWRPEVILKNCYFLWNFMGRGIFFLLMGCIVMGFRSINYAATGISWGIGLLYIVIWYTSFTLFPVAAAPKHDLETQAYL
ncbi:hypothetical protein LPJ61_000734 [Coemansia biformis]|uniref:COPI associated n=1 Tax=Coemansia biformis TaxID=1286918 RepID=A0A9W7YIA7_9FUNG|nr:hypothetical protein LPJ61_000734 [Coemansia biformis]